jgi:ABC-2 type transport system permease protein
MVRPAKGLVAVALREVDWIWHDRVALFLVLGVPLLAFAILSLTFSNAVVRELRVDVVDSDLSPTSAIFVQAVNAAPGVTRGRQVNNMAERHCRWFELIADKIDDGVTSRRTDG